MACSRCRKPIMPGVNMMPFFPLLMRPKDIPTTVCRFATVEGPKGRSCLITIPLRREMVTLKEGEKLTPLEQVHAQTPSPALVTEFARQGMDDGWRGARPGRRRSRKTAAAHESGGARFAPRISAV
jgi:hypothetical protein